MSEVFTIAPLKWRQAGRALVADTLGGATLHITPWTDRVVKRERYAVQTHGAVDRLMPRLDVNAETLDEAQAICDQYHRDRLAEWVVPAGGGKQ